MKTLTRPTDSVPEAKKVLFLFSSQLLEHVPSIHQTLLAFNMKTILLGRLSDTLIFNLFRDGIKTHPLENRLQIHQIPRFLHYLFANIPDPISL